MVNYCLCGCGGIAQRTYIKGHNRRGKNWTENQRKLIPKKAGKTIKKKYELGIMKPNKTTFKKGRKPYNLGYKNLRKFHCLNCNKEKEIHYKREDIFCNLNCYDIYRKKHPYMRKGTEKNGGLVNCHKCKKQIYRNKRRLEKSDKYFCSVICTKDGIITNCNYCDKNIYRTNRMMKKTNKQFCSLKCHNLHGHPFTSSIEIEMQKELKKRRIKFRPHKAISDIKNFYNCDMFIEPNIVIECDGDYWHDYPNGTEIDKIRNKQMKEKDYIVFRFWEHEIKENASLCVSEIQEYLERIPYYNEVCV